eukprot:6624160-Prymnesium_polylepis.2
MVSCIEAPREKKMVRFSPQHTKCDGLGTHSRGMKGAQPPESGNFENFFDPAPKHLARREHLLKDFGKLVPPPKSPGSGAPTSSPLATAGRRCRGRSAHGGRA